MGDTTVLLEGIDFGEGPRWHDGRLWFSDFYQRAVRAVTEDGEADVVLEIDDQPSGLGWLPDGDLLVVSMTKRSVLRWSGSGAPALHADLSSIATWHCNDMVVSATGHAYVGNFGFDLGHEKPVAADLAVVAPDGSVAVAAEAMFFPNGSVITPDGSTLIVGETTGCRYTAFDIGPDGTLSNRRLWAALGNRFPDGCCLDDGGGIWFANPLGPEVCRVLEGGEVTDTIETTQPAIACMLGGADGRTLFVLTSPSADPDTVAGTASSRLETVRVDRSRAGLP
jgi:sugar lactone lactonase YvrE